MDFFNKFKTLFDVPEVTKFSSRDYQYPDRGYDWIMNSSLKKSIKEQFNSNTA